MSSRCREHGDFGMRKMYRQVRDYRKAVEERKIEWRAVTIR
jgi:hypothetical protein